MLADQGLLDLSGAVAGDGLLAFGLPGLLRRSLGMLGGAVVLGGLAGLG